MKQKVVAVVFFICTFAIGLGTGGTIVANTLAGIIEEYRKSTDRYKKLFHILNRWLQLEMEGKSINRFFEANEYMNIAIYGMGCIGEAVVKDLMDSKVHVRYAIDRKAAEGSNGFMVSPDSKLEEVDLIVVTIMSEYGEIKKKLMKKVNCPVISIEDVLFEA